MMHNRKLTRKIPVFQTIINLLFFTLLLTGCKTAPISNEWSLDGSPETPESTTFFVAVPPSTENSRQIYLDIVDDITGMNMNPSRHLMSSLSENVYYIELPVPERTVLKYRYASGSYPTIVEHNAKGQPVFYRTYYAKSLQENIVRDVVSNWTSEPLNIDLGRIQGTIIDFDTGSGIPDLMVSVDGNISLTSATGEFSVNNLYPGKHLVTILSMDGNYGPFQQEAIIAPHSNTPINISLSRIPQVDVIFEVTPPPGHDPQIPIRMFGNITELGNVFYELPGGATTIAGNAPTLRPSGNSLYTLSLKLPVGFDLRYKYSIGDGFWNAERQTDYRFITRQLTVPEQPTTIHDSIATWASGDRSPIRIEIEEYSNEADNQLYIQFNPFTWMEPLPMMQAQNGLWFFELHSPLQLFSSIEYRICEDIQCTSPLNMTSSSSNGVNQLNLNIAQPVIIHQIETVSNTDTNFLDSNINILPREDHFITGIELAPFQSPSWRAIYPASMSAIKAETAAECVFLTPFWVSQDPQTPIIRQELGKTPSTSEISAQIQAAKDAGLCVAIYPSISMTPGDQDLWSIAANYDEGWWRTWFDNYRAFLLHHAQIANTQQISYLLIGEPQTIPSLTKDLSPSTESSILPIDFHAEWMSLINEIQNIYQGELFWVSHASQIDTIDPDWLSNFDGLYVLLDIERSATATESILDNSLFPLIEQTGMNVILGVRYPSTKNAENGCIQVFEDCISFDAADFPVNNISHLEVDETSQADAYHQLFIAVNDRFWIDGLVSRSYYLPYELKDNSNSIHGKNAEKVILHWFSNWKHTIP